MDNVLYNIISSYTLEDIDQVINEEGLRFANELNKKYAKDNNKFFFLNRKRIFNKNWKDSQHQYCRGPYQFWAFRNN